MTKPKQPKCKYCYDKGFYSVWKGIHGSADFPGDPNYGKNPDWQTIPCPKCQDKKGMFCTCNGEAHEIEDSCDKTFWQPIVGQPTEKEQSAETVTVTKLVAPCTWCNKNSWEWREQYHKYFCRTCGYAEDYPKPKEHCECTCHNDEVDFMPIGCMNVERMCFKCHSPRQPAEKEQDAEVTGEKCPHSWSASRTGRAIKVSCVICGQVQAGMACSPPAKEQERRGKAIGYVIEDFRGDKKNEYKQHPVKQTKEYEENLDWEMRYWDLVDELRRQSPKPGSDGPVTVFGYKTCDNGATPVLYTVPDWGNIAKFIKNLLRETEERVRKETLEIIAQGEGWEENGSLGHYRKILNQKDETEN